MESMLATGTIKNSETGLGLMQVTLCSFYYCWGQSVQLSAREAGLWQFFFLLFSKPVIGYIMIVTAVLLIGVGDGV